MRTLTDLGRLFGVSATAVRGWRNKAEREHGKLPFQLDGPSKLYELAEQKKILACAPLNIRQKNIDLSEGQDSGQASGQSPAQVGPAAPVQAAVDAELIEGPVVPESVGVSNGLAVNSLNFVPVDRAGAIAALAQDIQQISGVGDSNLAAFAAAQVEEASQLGLQIGLMRGQALQAGIRQGENLAMSQQAGGNVAPDVRVHCAAEKSVGGQSVPAPKPEQETEQPSNQGGE